ncbi:restriction endonuclease subunit S [Cohaesibacter marisflavi]|uniref:restriction endonuclease subunit S n=1 Tax=Cohaesibacter marisflavi TaxID=655353 RepID=UPI0029C62F20|nr:restriction endonuclease subunit S [Cohaesibacter marisflavi]
MVPEGWRRKRVDQLFHVQLGKMLNKQAKVGGDQHVYLTNKNVRWGSFALAELNSMSFSDCEREKFSLWDGDLLVCEGGEIGRCAIWRGAVANCYYQKALHRLRRRSDEVDVEFVFNVFLFGSTNKLFSGLGTQTSIAHLTKERLSEISILLPPLPEQKKIAEILSTWDRAIEVAERQLENARRQKKALMQQLLTGTRRLPGFDGEWKTVKLGDVCELVNGRGFKPHEWSDEGYPIIRIQNLNGSDEFNYYNGSFNPKLLVVPGDLLFAWSGSRGTSFGPHIWNGPKAVLNYHTWNVKPRRDLDKVFFYWLLQQITAEIENSAHGAAALVHTQKREMEKRLISVPQIEEQKQLAETMGLFLQDEELCYRKLVGLRSEKRALMQQLLTGKKRVTV